MIKQFTIAAIASLALFAGAAQAASAQQTKMKTCNADAKTKALKGDERKAFMKTCLSAAGAEAAPAADAKSTQQQKMKTCNVDAKAKALKGADRKKFMSECLSA